MAWENALAKKRLTQFTNWHGRPLRLKPYYCRSTQRGTRDRDRRELPRDRLLHFGGQLPAKHPEAGLPRVVPSDVVSTKGEVWTHRHSWCNTDLSKGQAATGVRRHCRVIQFWRRGRGMGQTYCGHGWSLAGSRRVQQQWRKQRWGETQNSRIAGC